MYLQFSVYNSPSPQILLVPGQQCARQYGPRSYAALILTEKLGRGATGDVYRVTHAPRSGILGKSHLAVVAKIAASLTRLHRLRHEWSVYEHLREAQVSGIPDVFGFFQDAPREAGVLIQAHAGRPISYRMDDSQGRGIRFTAKEK